MSVDLHPDARSDILEGVYALSAFIPVHLFEIVDPTLPSDWLCSVNLGDTVDLVLGPEFISRDLESYSAMVDQEVAQVQRLFEMAEPRTSRSE